MLAFACGPLFGHAISAREVLCDLIDLIERPRRSRGCYLPCFAGLLGCSPSIGRRMCVCELRDVVANLSLDQRAVLRLYQLFSRPSHYRFAVDRQGCVALDG